MKREIKFRAWCKYTATFGTMFSHNELFDSHEYQNPFMQDDIILMQYTGLKDKNGVEIYEGDIVKYGKDAPEQVVFKECCFCIYLKHNNHILRLQVFNGINKYEVIGNIHENKDLLV